MATQPKKRFRNNQTLYAAKLNAEFGGLDDDIDDLREDLAAALARIAALEAGGGGGNPNPGLPAGAWVSAGGAWTANGSYLVS